MSLPHSLEMLQSKFTQEKPYKIKPRHFRLLSRILEMTKFQKVNSNKQYKTLVPSLGKKKLSITFISSYQEEIIEMSVLSSWYLFTYMASVYAAP